MTTSDRATGAGLDAGAQHRAVRLSAATAACAVFGVIGYDPLKPVPVNAVHAVLLVLLALTAFLGARRGSRGIVLGVGATMIVLAMVRLVTYGYGSDLIGGVGTAALLTGLGMAYIGSTLVGIRPGT